MRNRTIQQPQAPKASAPASEDALALLAPELQGLSTEELALVVLLRLRADLAQKGDRDIDHK
jgi:hypothetical protein